MCEPSKQSWGTTTMKQALWNKEFEVGWWASVKFTTGDYVYLCAESIVETEAFLILGAVGDTGKEADLSNIVAVTRFITTRTIKSDCLLVFQRHSSSTVLLE
jgi:hypothetical protein